MTDVLTVENLRVAFAFYDRELEVVRDVSFKLRAGSVLAVVGESGSGKSVTAQAIMGLLPANGRVSGGRILFADPAQPGAAPVNLAELPVDGVAIRAIRGARISKIFQEPMTSLSPVHTIGDQVQEALTIHRAIDPQAARAETLKMLGLVGFPDPERAYGMYAFELSGGLRQRAMIAMALMCRPAVLIADEPTTALDVTIQAQVLKLLKDLQSQLGMAILLITHDLGVVANMADDVAVLYRGELMEYGTAQDLLRRPQHPYLKALMSAVPRFDMGANERLTSLRDVVRPRSPDKPAKAPSSPASTEGGDALLTIKGLRKSYGGERKLLGSAAVKRFVAVDDVSLQIKRGECLGLVGESGCGKTTLSKMIMRAVTPDRGTILFDPGGEAVDVTALEGNRLKAFRPNVQMVFQDPVSSLSPRMTVLDVLREPLEVHRRGSGREQLQRAAELMEWVGLDPTFLSRYPHSFSGGQRQRIGIARALALSPRLLLLDEPVSALDVSVQAQILNLLKDLKAELGLTYLFISHNLAVVDYMADNIAVMARGRIVEYATRHQLFRDPIHPYTRLLLKSVPYADLDRPMDFNLLGVRGATDESNWPALFRSEGGRQLAHIDVGDGHIVLADPNCSAQELRA